MKIGSAVVNIASNPMEREYISPVVRKQPVEAVKPVQHEAPSQQNSRPLGMNLAPTINVGQYSLVPHTLGKYLDMYA